MSNSTDSGLSEIHNIRYHVLIRANIGYFELHCVLNFRDHLQRQLRLMCESNMYGMHISKLAIHRTREIDIIHAVEWILFNFVENG